MLYTDIPISLARSFRQACIVITDPMPSICMKERIDRFTSKAHKQMFSCSQHTLGLPGKEYAWYVYIA